MSVSNTQISEKERELIVARLEVLSPELHFSSGNGANNISRDEMIKHVNNGDDIGREYVKTEMEFLRAFKNGSVLKSLAFPLEQGCTLSP